MPASEPVRRHDGVADDFTVDGWSHLLGGLAARFDGVFKRLGALETRLFEDHLGQVDRPVYVTGLARSGSTILLEMLSWHPGVVTHRYRDFPLLHVPVLWNRFLDRAAPDTTSPRERAHRDGILVNRESPEAFEEVLWMSYFPHLHDPARVSVLERRHRDPAFDRFYEDHIRKLLMLRGGSRYVSKGNYNITRLDYLLDLFPEARFVVPVRSPDWHVASLMKQHRLFLEGQRDNPRAVAHLRRAGHFEFGIDRRPINTGSPAAVEAVQAAWSDGREVEGWALYWRTIYDFVLDRLAADPRLATATLVLPYEALCRDPGRTAEQLFTHCGLAADPALVHRAERQVRFPTYYAPDLSDRERETIDRYTADTRARLNAHVAAATPAVSEPLEKHPGMRIA